MNMATKKNSKKKSKSIKKVPKKKTKEIKPIRAGPKEKEAEELPKGILEEDYKLTYDFAVKLNKKFKELIKSIVLFGSVAKKTPKKGSDIDIAILVDDATIEWDREAIAWYREELKKIISSMTHGDRFHVNTITLSSFWDNMVVGEPAVINIMRYGIAVLDTGFFEPLKFLLFEGRIKPTPEAVFNCSSRVPWHTFRGKTKLLSAIGDFYWACVDASHAPLMQQGYVPPSPEHVGDLLEKVFVKKNKLPKKYIDWYNELYKLAHKIKENQIRELPGTEYDKWLKRTEEFTKKMHSFLDIETPKPHTKPEHTIKK
ncbi:hypothetical protein GF374_00430 [Candidatus Woesearchaeota archaeon]|nr:hypothetical protein [Candidatus Woesearchaeota archaeon]